MVQVERYLCLWYQRGIRSICPGNFELCLEKSSLSDYLHSRAFHWENSDRSRNLSVFFRVWHWWADGTFHGIQSCQRSGSNLPCLSSKFQFFWQLASFPAVVGNYVNGTWPSLCVQSLTSLQSLISAIYNQQGSSSSTSPLSPNYHHHSNSKEESKAKDSSRHSVASSLNNCRTIQPC